MGVIESLGFGSLFVITLRIFAAITIFRWPLFGTVFSILADLLDVVILTFLPGNSFYNDNYTKVDKALDWVFLLVITIYAFRNWKGIERNVSLCLFGYRTIGVILIETVGTRELLFVFPNLFLLFALFVMCRDKYFPSFKITNKNIAPILLILLVPKLFQEYVLHIAQVHPWGWMMGKLGLGS